MDILKLIGRNKRLFDKDVLMLNDRLNHLINNASFLVIGGAGSIGQAAVKEIFNRNPRVLHVVDISENNLVELVRDIRSTVGYNGADFRTFVLDVGSIEFRALIDSSDSYDYVLNLSALKHVRSEKDPYTLMRLIQVNILNTLSSIEQSYESGSKKYFCVSTDKAANPVNMMGASKRIMEMFLMRESRKLPISTARFANVAFSDGSLLHGFNQRFMKRQPITAPSDVKRYFVTPKEAGELCLISCLQGENRDIFFPKLTKDLKLTSFSEIAVRYLENIGYEAYECKSEDEARNSAEDLIAKKRWPVYFFESDTTGEKDFEEFYTDADNLDLERFIAIGVIKNDADTEKFKLDYFLEEVRKIKAQSHFNKPDIVCLFKEMIPEFDHQEKGKSLDQRM